MGAKEKGCVTCNLPLRLVYNEMSDLYVHGESKFYLNYLVVFSMIDIKIGMEE